MQPENTRRVEILDEFEANEPRPKPDKSFPALICAFSFLTFAICLDCNRDQLISVESLAISSPFLLIAVFAAIKTIST